MKRKLVGLAAIIMALGMVGCGGEKEAEPCEEHVWGDTYVLDGENGDAGHHRVCTVCGEAEESASHVFKQDSSKTNVAATCVTAGANYKICKCGKTKTETVAADASKHNMVENTAKQGKAASCAEAGTKWMKCSNAGCTNEQEVADSAKPATGHTMGTSTPTAAVGDSAPYTKSGFSTATCSKCQQVEIRVNAMNYTNLSGSLKSAPDASMKLGDNDQFIEYTFDSPVQIDNAQVYLYGWIDYFGDSNSNKERTLFSGKNNGDATPNIKIEVGQTTLSAVEITNKQTMLQMGMTAHETRQSSSNPTGTDTLVPVGGTANIVVGTNKIKYTRLESYNLNVLEIVFIGTPKTR